MSSFQISCREQAAILVCVNTLRTLNNNPSQKISLFLVLYGLILVLKVLPWTQKACIPGLKSFSRPERPNSVSPQRPAWSLMNLFCPLTLGLQGLKKTLSTFLTPQARIRPKWPLPLKRQNRRQTRRAWFGPDCLAQKTGDRGRHQGPRGPRWCPHFCGNGHLGAIETEPSA